MYVRKCGSSLENGRFGGRTGPGAGCGSGWLPRKLKKVGTKRSYLQRSASIQPKTSGILPKIGNYPTVHYPTRPSKSAVRGVASLTAFYIYCCCVKYCPLLSLQASAAAYEAALNAAGRGRGKRITTEIAAAASYEEVASGTARGRAPNSRSC